MSGAAGMLFMSLVLGAASFGLGTLPLFLNFTAARLTALSAGGTGLLLGAALGIIIPEGVETTAHAYAGQEFPTSEIALSLLVGFVLMLVVEQAISHGHRGSSDSHVSLGSSRSNHEMNSSSSEVQFDAGMEDMEMQLAPRASELSATDRSRRFINGEGRKEAFPLTVGLSIHGIADGLALGVSALSDSQSGHTSELSLVVFMALLIHKAPTTIAFTTSLLSTSLPRPEIKKYIGVFSVSTPLGAIVSYGLFYILGAGTAGDMSGLALLVSGGSFLYVATVLQPASDHSEGPSELRKSTRTLLIVLGMVIPFLISVLVGHDHGANSETVSDVIRTSGVNIDA